MIKENTVRSFWNERWGKLDTPKPTKSSHYFISDYGRIKSLHKVTGKETLLKGSLLRGGYRTLNIRLIENKRLTVFIHKFVAKHFIPNDDPEKIFAIHLDQDKNNNHWKNLKWVSRSELTQWQLDQGIYSLSYKKRPKNTKMTETRVKMALQWIKEGKTKKKIIAKRLGISTMQLNRIERGENWGYVQLDEAGIKNQ